MLRDTGAAQSLIVSDVLRLAPETYTGTNILLRGVGAECIKVPLHRLFLRSDLVTGYVNVAVCTQLPVDGVEFILGNDLAGG